MSIFQFAGRWGPEIFENENRQLLRAAEILVVEKGTNTPITLYTDRTKAAAAPNPFLTDSRGNGSFFADPGEYDIVYAGHRLTITVDMDYIEARGDGPPTGPAGGDLDGFYPDPTVPGLASKATPADIANAVEAHRTDTTDVHGIPNTADLATKAEVTAVEDGVSANLSDHISDTTGVHGIPDTSVLVTQAAMAAAIDTAINDLIAGAPGALDTLNEIAAAFGDDPNFAATITNSLATKLDKATLDANTVLVADADDVPVARAMAPSTILARLATGGIVAATPEQIKDLLAIGSVGTFAGDIGAGTGVVNVVHNLDSLDIASVTVRKVSTGEIWSLGVTIVDANTIALDFGTYTRAANEFRVKVSI